jgi:tetratricopeptide (TPR) repeat protein
MSLARLKENDDAIRELRSVLALNPQSTAARYNLGVLLEDKGNYEEAIHNFLDVRKVQPDDAGALLHLVSAYYAAGDSQQAVRLAQEAASNDPKADLAGRIAEMMIRHNDFEKAVQLLEPVRSRVSSSGLDVTLARAYIGAGQPGRALDLLKSAQARETSWQIAYLLGLAYVSEHQTQSAITAFRDAIRLNPDQPDAHYRLGKLLLSATDETDQQTGVAELSRAIALEPRNSEYYNVLGRWFLQHDYLKAAIEVLNQGIKDGTPAAELEAMMALAQAALHGGPSARPFAERALQLDSRLALAHYLVGFCYFSAGDYAQAVKYYEQATTLDSHNDVYSYNTAVALQRLNRISAALPYAQRSTELNPDRSLNHYLLGKLYSKLDRDAEAVAELEASLRLNPALDNSYYLLAQIYDRSGNATRAQEMRDKLAQLKQSRQSEVRPESPESEPKEMISPSRVLQDRN